MNEKQKKLKVFIIAYACQPNSGSESGIGWNVVNQLTSYHDVHVLTNAENKNAIENYYDHNNLKKPTFYYYNLPKFLIFWKKGARGYQLHYYLWLYFSYFYYRKMVKFANFDIIHHLTFAQNATPNLFIARNPGKAKTIWGPVGWCNSPGYVRERMPFTVKMKEFIRSSVKNILTTFDVMRIQTERNTDLLISYPQKTDEILFRKKRKGQLICYPQTGININDSEYDLPEKQYPEHGTRVLICSMFWHWKGCTFASEAFARLAKRNPHVSLTIIGSGPEETEMKKIFSDYQVSDRVSFVGFVSKRRMMEYFHNSDVLIYPSYHHGLATGILQAMWAKLPIVAMQGDFVASAVAEGAGLCACGKTLNEVIDDIANKTELILQNRDLRMKFGKQGHELVKTKYSWDILVSGLNRIYLQLKADEKFEEYKDYSIKE